MYKEISEVECEIKQEKESDFFLVSGLKEGDFIKVQVELTDCGELNGIYYPIIKIKGTKKIKNNTLIQTDSIMSDNDLVIKSDRYIRKYTQKYVSECNYDKFIGYTENK
jgi:hypothetical protein